MNKIKVDLLPCPFCGGEAVVRECKVFLADGILIQCSHCPARQDLILIDHPKLTAEGLDESTRYTREQAIEKAASEWNRRYG